MEGKMQLLNLLLFWLFFGILSSHLAKKKGRNPRIWFFIGLLFGAFGVALLYLLPLFEKLKAKKAVVQPKPLPPQSQRRDFWSYLDTTHKIGSNIPIYSSNTESSRKTRVNIEKETLWIVFR